MASGQNHKLRYATDRLEMAICDLLYLNPKSEQIFMRPYYKKLSFPDLCALPHFIVLLQHCKYCKKEESHEKVGGELFCLFLIFRNVPGCQVLEV